MKTATLIDLDLNWRGDARLFKLSEPVEYDNGETEYVIVSACDTFDRGPETFIFPAREDGAAIDYGEMGGSIRGEMDHALALANMGFAIADTTQTTEA
jgi:hypothetical protein